LLHHELPVMMFCPTKGPEATEPVDHGLKHLKPWASFKLIFSGILSQQ
jgi:hypothetical protein